MPLRIKKEMKIKILSKEYKVKIPTMYETQKLLDKGIYTVKDLTYFLSDIYGEELAYVLFELYDFEGILQFVTKTLPSVLNGEDIEIETPNNFKEINNIYNVIKKGEQEYGTQIL